MVRMAICVCACFLCGAGPVAASPARGANEVPGFSLDDDEMRAVVRRGRLALSVRYRCTTGCGGRFEAAVRTLGGRVLYSRRVSRVAAAPRSARLRLTFPLRLSYERLELLVLRYRYRKGKRQRVGTVALSRILDGPRLKLLGQKRLEAGSAATLRVLVVRARDGRPLAGVRCTAVLSGGGLRRQVQRGRTSPGGAFRPVFQIGSKLAGRRLRLRVVAHTSMGKRTLQAKLRVGLRAKVLLTLDKPIYQPGQTLHLRTLTLRDPAGGAVVNAPLRFQIRDGRGNLVHQRTLRTDAFGVAHSRFRLATRINPGRYRVEARVSLPGGTTRSVTRTVRVFTYRLPRLRLRTKLHRAFVKPGELISGEVYAWYVFGKPVKSAQVVLDASFRDPAAGRFARFVGRTDRWGAFRFRLRAPAFTGASGRETVRLVIRVREPGGEERSTQAAVPVVTHPIRVTLIPESGALAPGVTQKVHVLTTLPGGGPVAARVRLTLAQPGQRPISTTLRTGGQGLGSVLVRPRRGTVRFTGTARDARGRTGVVGQTLLARGKGGAILVRPARALYREGERLEVTVLSDQRRGHAYLDLIRGGQTLSTHDVTLKNGRGRLSIPLGPGSSGVVLLSAYRFGDQGLIRDVRPVMVQRDRDLRIRVTADREVYRPGQPATLSFAVTDEQGQPVVAALGVMIIDSAVYALTRSAPELTRTFFRLERSLLKAQIPLPGLAPETLLARAATAAARRRQLRAAEVLLSAASPGYQYSLSLDDEAAHNRRLARRQVAAATPILRRIGWKVVYALRRYYRGRCPYCVDTPSVKTLLKKRLLGAYTLRDPWGEQLDVEIGKDDGRGLRFTVTLGSDGPDELRHTADDLSVTLRFSLRKPKGRKGYFGNHAVGCEAEGVLGCLMGHTVGDSIGLGGLGLSGGGRGGGGGGGVGYFLGSSGSWKGSRSDKPGPGDPSGRAPVRVRKHFPEALAVRPALITDASGHATLRLRMADSITTWRLAALASTAAGQLGSAERSLRVFTPFFVDVTLPPELTRGDRITVPVALHNHRPVADTVTVTLKPAPWFAVVGSKTRQVRVRARSVSSVSFVIRARRVGTGRLRVEARGARVADAVERRVAVRPDGNRVDFGRAASLRGTFAHVVNVPRDAVPGSAQLQVEVAPGALAAAVDGLEAMLREPTGCFEQTSSAAYPNVMILRYLQRNKRHIRVSPLLLKRTRGYVSRGYQRLVTFESKRGGFSLFGGGTPDKMLTAYGLHEFVDMARVHPVDRALIRRTRLFLARRQRADGSWDPQPSYFFHGRVILEERVLATAYVAWALLRAGERGRPVRRALAYVRRHLSGVKGAYTLAVVASALEAQSRYHRLLPGVLARLLGLRKSTRDQAWWTVDEGQTLTRSQGRAAQVETTALVTSVLLRARRHLGVARKGLRYLVAARSARGGWSTTQANVLAIRALLDARTRGGATDARGTVSITVDGRPAGTMTLTKNNAGVTQTLDLTRYVRPGHRHQVALRYQGKGAPLAQVRGSYHRPYGKKRTTGYNLSPRSSLALRVKYSQHHLAPRRPVTVLVRLVNRSAVTATAPMIELGRPAGFTPELSDLQRLVRQRKIARFELRARRIVIYLDKLAPQKTLHLRYRLRAPRPLRVTAPPSEAYEYYAADLRTRTPATVLTVQ